MSGHRTVPLPVLHHFCHARSQLVGRCPHKTLSSGTASSETLRGQCLLERRHEGWQVADDDETEDREASTLRKFANVSAISTRFDRMRSFNIVPAALGEH